MNEGEAYKACMAQRGYQIRVTTAEVLGRER
jgi:hypothetical protein